MNNKSEKKIIYICEKSKTLKNIFLSSFDLNEFELFFYDDSYDLLKEISNSNPDGVLFSSLSFPINSFELIKFIKSNVNTKSIFVGLYYLSDENFSDFFIDELNVDYVFTLNSETIESHVKNISNKINKLEKNYNNFSEKDLIINISNVISKDSYKKLILKNLINFYSDSLNVNSFVKNVFSFVDCLINADGICLNVCFQNKIINFSQFDSSFSNNEIEDFLLICKTDFELNISKLKKYVQQKIKFERSYNLNKDFNNKKINSYKFFIKNIDDCVISLHIGSNEINYFTDLYVEQIEYLFNEFSKLLCKLITFENLSYRENKLKSLFSRFVPPEVIEDLIKTSDNKTNFVGQKQQIAILICDIRGFTTISEYNEPENVVSFLNKYFTVMVDIIKQNGGSIDKFMGDAIMALFGAPISYEDNCDRAVQAAIEMKNALKHISCENLFIPENKKIDIGIGIHYGNVIFGSIGCAEKTDYTVIGDSVNLASRLEGLTKQYGVKIVISQDVVDNLKKEFFIRMLDKVKVKGKSIAVSIYSVDFDDSEYNSEYLDCYRKALDLYFLGGWNLSREYFEKCLQLASNDVAANCMLKRCIDFANNPPSDWDGATSLTTK